MEKNSSELGNIVRAKGSKFFFQDNFVLGLIHASFTKTNLPDSSLAEAPPDIYIYIYDYHI